MDVLTNACFLSLFVGQVLAYSQLVNINTTAVSSTQYGDYVASRVVDGNIDQYHTNCSHTSSRKTIQFAWLYVDLGKVFSVHSVKLWYRNDKRSPNARAKRLRGYHIRVSKNKKEPLESESCYQDSGTGFPLTILEQECKGEARYIWFYQSTKLPEDPCPMLEICEVQVLGCETGTYGESCLKKCYHCKNNATCGIQNGECDGSGCIGLYKPPLCKECIKGMYGNNCEKNCNPLCKIGECNRITGVCLDGCMTGYKGNFCNHTCKTRSYGMNCKEACGHCYRNTTCRHDNGTCQQGCAAGYKSHDCKTPCTDGEYGMNCNFNCSRHCLYGEVCNRIDGSCRSCEDGYEGFKCNTKCEAGKYGKACSESCGACLNSTVCNHITGDCELGCEPGWQNTAQCKTACINGTFGLSCKHNCSGNCLNVEPCNSIDGTCTFCSEGWENIWCNKTCNATWFGDGCKSQCGYCLGENNCHHVNGSCLLGCQEGFTGELCFNRTLQMDVSFPGTLDLTVLLLIVCPVAGLLFIALCVVTVVFLLRDGRHRKRKQKNETTNEKFQEIEDQDNEDEESQETLDDTMLYTTVQIRSKSIKTTDLPSVIKSMGSDTDKGFTEEFNSIPYGEQSDILCTVGKLPENIPKNRFKTTFPYDHSRVVLQSSKNRDYINANFIKNTYGDAVYIASQGPKPKTVGDFWQMVWQENVLVIVMVTNLKEGDKIKCERYWPTSGDSNMVLEIFTVQLFSERIYANFSIHNLKLFNRETQGTRQITHLQYTSWPDHGTPNPLELLSFYHYVSRALEQHPEQKLVVHCSAGIGRTGTFIALDALHRQGVKKGKINIVEYVHTMREDRMNMIQNLNQYKFLYHALYESFRAGCHILRKENFVQEMEAHIKTDKATNLSNFRTEFKELDSMRRVFDESEKQIGLQNLKLNMTENVLPADRMRIILSSHVPERGTYYNAVPISTFTSKDCIIAGQYPVQGAGIDLIRLLLDQDCSSLVLTHPLSEIPHSGGWFSDPSFNYRVEVGAVTKMSADVNKCNVRIKPPSSKGWHKVSMYEIKTWNPTENLPQVLLDAVKRIQLCELVDPERKLTILSRDGASRCGEFCAVYNAIQQLQQDQEVDMFNIVRQLQSRRPEMISDLNEYLLCCQAVAEFIKSDSEDTYMNSVSNTVTVEENMYANT